MNELLSKSTGVSLALALKIAGGVIALVLIYSTISMRISIVEQNQARRMDANLIGSMELLKAKEVANESRFVKIEVETNSWAQSKQLFKQMSEDIKIIKNYFIKAN